MQIHAWKEICAGWGSYTALSNDRMEELGLHPTDRQVYFGQLLGMCDQISFPLGELASLGGGAVWDGCRAWVSLPLPWVQARPASPCTSMCLTAP